MRKMVIRIKNSFMPNILDLNVSILNFQAFTIIIF